ncbi:MAG: excinuclease ABC subunit UvrC [Gemmatimonadaceae bacterium]|nr:excinuclease ABC subunit UvrC [Gemmatimonadaceae bacterium]
MSTTERMPDAVAAKVPNLPETPGVYLWKDAEGTILYVGKAKRLRSRVRSYFAADHTSPKTIALVRRIADVDTLVVPTEAHALILENNLIKEYHPRFNVALRDDKSYPYIKVTLQEPFPRVYVTRRLTDDGARYFGPYTDVGAMRRALNVVKRLFTVRSCHYALPREAPERPCLDWFIKRCLAPCVGYQTEADYRGMIDDVVAFLDGRTGEVIRRVRDRMLEASERLDFETAGELRDALRHLEKMEEPTVVLEVEGGDRDVVGYARDGEDACAVVLRIRDGKLLAREHRLLEQAEDVDDPIVLTAFLLQWYRTAPGRARHLLLPFAAAEQEVVEEALDGTQLRVPQRGPRRALVDLAEQNARHLLEEFKLAAFEADERATDPVYELQRELGLPRVPRTLVCFDISHAQGKDTVASGVWFENGRPRRSEYRKYTVRDTPGIDDFRSMQEVVGRFVRRRLEEEKGLPDLIVIDGGKGQLNAAVDALRDAGAPGQLVISLAKRDEEIFLPGRSDGIRLPRRSPALRLLQQARDEAHRFAITFQRQKRATRTITSELLSIPGVGPTRRRSLLHRFGSVQGVRDAALEDIAAIPGFGLALARAVHSALGVEVPALLGEADAPPADATEPSPLDRSDDAPDASSPDASSPVPADS